MLLPEKSSLIVSGASTSKTIFDTRPEYKSSRAYSCLSPKISVSTTEYLPESPIVKVLLVIPDTDSPSLYSSTAVTLATSDTLIENCKSSAI